MTARFLSLGLGAALWIGWTACAAAQSPGRTEAGGAVDPTPGGSLGQTPASTSNDPFDQAEAPAHDAKGDATHKLEKATFGAGCFWHVEAEFEWLPGVKSAVSGYAGGRVPDPSYEMVHEGETGHIEVVQVEYDPSIISYEKLLQVFWHGHDPTQWNRQGPDIGTQYRSAIFYHSEDQRKAALKSYRELVAKRAYRRPIVTLLLPMKAFYRAEEYHQNYYGGRPEPPVRRMSRAKRAAIRAAQKKAAADRKSEGTADTKPDDVPAKPSESTAPSQPGSGPK